MRYEDATEEDPEAEEKTQEKPEEKKVLVSTKASKKEEPVAKKKTRQISGYIDLAQRFQTEDFRPYFLKERLLLPRNGDLSYYNWNTQNPTVADSRNFRVVANSKAGLLFRNKLDRKDIDVNPKLVVLGTIG